VLNNKIFVGDPNTLLSIDQFLAKMAGSPASQRVLIADCCRFDSTATRGRSVGSSMSTADLPKNTAVLFACSEDQKAYEHRSWGHGAFTKCLLESMEQNSLISSIAFDVGGLPNKPGRVQQLVDQIKVDSDPTQIPAFLINVPAIDLGLKIRRGTLPINEPTDEPMDTSADQTTDEEYTNSIGMQLKLLPAGDFLMGSTETKAELERMGISTYDTFDNSDEQPQHRVKISRDFYLGVHEVTLSQFLQYYNADKVNHKTEAEKDGKGGWGYDGTNFEQKRSYVAWNTGWNQPVKDYMNHPVVNVSWNDAVSFCEWLTKTEQAAGRITRQQEYRLPSEAQWEYACRGGSRGSKLFSFGNNGEDFVRNGNVRDAAYAKELNNKYGEPIIGSDGYVFTSPVGKFQSNGFGLFDMHGNVLEWCEDVYDSKVYGLRSSVTSDPLVSAEGSYRVDRGGSWSSAPVNCRSAYRDGSASDFRISGLGFRVSLSSVQ